MIMEEEVKECVCVCYREQEIMRRHKEKARRREDQVASAVGNEDGGGD